MGSVGRSPVTSNDPMSSQGRQSASCSEHQQSGYPLRVITIIDVPSIEIIDGMFAIGQVSQVPVASSLFRFVRRSPPWLCDVRMAQEASPTPNPGNVAAKATAKIHRGSMQGLLRGSGPKLERVSVAAAAMAVVAAHRHVYRERAAMPGLGHGLVQGTNSVPLSPRSSRRMESKQVQDLLHRDLGTDSVEVDARHGCSSLSRGRRGSVAGGPFRSNTLYGERERRPSRDQGTARFSAGGPFRSHYSSWGTGTAPLGCSVDTLPARGRAAEPAGPLQ